MRDYANRELTPGRARDTGTAAALPGKQTLVEQLYAQAAPAAPGRGAEPVQRSCTDCGTIAGAAGCPSCKGAASRTAGAVAGKPVASTPLTEADRVANLESPQLAGDQALENAFDNSPPIYVGATGPHIQKVQQALIDVGLPLPRSTKNGTAPPDGVFGTETLQMIKGLQFRQGIQRDGVIGRQTLGELDSLLTGNHVPGTPATTSATTIATTDVQKQDFQPCGDFTWAINWNTDGRNGYIVQEITQVVHVNACDGSPDPVFTPKPSHFWEAWRVQTDGGVHGSEPNDTFSPGLNIIEHGGTWKITSKVFWVDTLETIFRFGAVDQAGGLLSTTTMPSNLGPALLTRGVAGKWDCCNGNSTHVSIDPATVGDAPDPAAPNQPPDQARGPAK
jgi:peptidoglycan hydrolase-like protein with peptidoglycan-binding domain